VSHFFYEFDRLTVFVAADFGGVVDYQGKILCHEAFLDCFDDTSLELFSEDGELRSVIKLGTMKESS
jgi:hypothetical protein